MKNLLPAIRVALLLLILLGTSQGYAQYCAVTGYVNGNVKISSLRIGSVSINNVTVGGYYDFSSRVTQVYKRTKYPLTVTCPAPLTPNICSRWVDWNHDSIFDPSERQDLIQFSNGTLFRDTIVPPAGALPGLARMRTVLFYRQADRTMNPCASTAPNSDGSVWDVTLNVDTANPSLPPCAQLLMPIDSSTNVLTNTPIRWRLPITGPISGYKVYLDTLPNASVLIGTTTFDTTFTPTQQLLGGKTYFLKVVPFNTVGDAISCDTFQFTTTTNPPNCPTVTSPAGGGAISTRTVQFNWLDNGGNTSTYTILTDTVSPPTAIIAQGLTGLSHRTLINLLPNRKYYYQVLAVNALGISRGCGIDSVLTTDSIGYCSVSFLNSGYHISQVQFQSVTDNGVTRSGYFDRKPRTLTAPIGSAVPVTVTVSGGDNNNTIYAYIDWNQNGSFIDAGERITASGGPANFTFDVTAPIGAVVGRTTMRLALWFRGNGAFNAPCGAFSFDGNALDYNVLVQNPLGCTGRPRAGVVSVDSVRCDNGVGYLKVVGTSIASNLSLRWLKLQGGTWVNANTANDTLSTLNTGPNATPTRYRFVATCLNTSLTDSSNIITLSGAPIAAPTVRDSIRCGTGTLMLRASSPLIGGSYRWYRGMTGLSADSVSGAPIATSTLIRNGVLAGDSVVRYVAFRSAQGCESPRVRVIGRILALPTAPIITPSAAQAACAGDSITLTAPAGFAAYLWSNTLLTQSITVRIGANYSVRVTNAGGCQSVASTAVAVTFAPKPNRPTLALNPANNIITATVLPNANGLTFSWYLNGILLPSQSASTINSNVLGLGAYTVLATRNTTPFCTSDTSAPVSILVGLGNSIGGKSVKVYPNPTTGTFMLDLPNGTYNLTITDLAGKTWLTQPILSVSEPISISEVPVGVYILRVQGGNSVWYERLVKE